MAFGGRFREDSIEAGGFRIRYQEAGEGPALVHLHGAGGLRLTPAHELLSRTFRVIALEMPGFGNAENQRTQTIQDLATTMTSAVSALGLTRFNLMGTSFGGTVACWMAVQRRDLLAAMVLDAPSAIRPEGSEPVSGSPEEVAGRLYAHPERDSLPRPRSSPCWLSGDWRWCSDCVDQDATPGWRKGYAGCACRCW